MVEVARQSSAMVSTGRRRLKIIILQVVAVILVALLLGAFVYLLYNNINSKDSACTGEQAMIIQTTSFKQTSSSTNQSPLMTSTGSVTKVSPKLPSTTLESTIILSVSPALTAKSSSSGTESTELITTSRPVVTTEQISPGITATSCETDLTGTPLDCSEVWSCGGVFYVFPYGEEGVSVPVYCACEGEMEIWTVIQKRFDGSVDFNRTWTDYKNGFGDSCGEYWLGNEALHVLTTTKSFKLHIIATGWDGSTKYAIYSSFTVADEANGYRLNFGNFLSGNAGDSLAGHNGCKFSTKDRDNDANSTLNYAERSSGGWWYCDGLQSNLNGHYYPSSDNPDLDGILWTTGYGNNSLRETTMMVQPTTVIVGD